MVVRKIEYGGMDWIKLAQDRDQWRAFVNMEMNLKKAPWSESASELYRPSDRRLSAK
jgi:hypothetical protein